MSDQTAIDRERWKKLEAIEHSGQGVAMFASDFRWLMAAARERDMSKRDHIQRLKLHMEEVVLARRERDERHRLQIAAAARAEQAEAEQARLRAALKRLRQEVAGALGIAERDIRSILGNTNVAVIKDRIAEADAALAGAPEGKEVAASESHWEGVRGTGHGESLVRSTLAPLPDAAARAPEGTAAERGDPKCCACADGECPLHLGTPSHLGANQPAPPAAPLHAALDVVWRVEVVRESDGRYGADITSGDGKVGASAGYSMTPVGALADACATLIKIAEDDASPAVPSSPTPEASELCNGNGIIVCGHRKGHDGPHDFWHVEEDE